MRSVLFQSEITDSERELTSRFVSNGFDYSFHYFYNFKKVCDSRLNRKEYGQEPAVSVTPWQSPLHEGDLAAEEGDRINHVSISETGRGRGAVCPNGTGRTGGGRSETGSAPQNNWTNGCRRPPVRQKPAGR